jgi:signal transduction histidine kinase
MVRIRPLLVCTVAALVLSATAARVDAAPRRVLLLYSYEREFSQFNFARLFRPELTRTSPEPIDFIELSLQSVRASRSQSDAAILDDLRGMLGDRALDLVVPLGGPAASFTQKYRSELFPHTPILLAGVDSRFLESGPLPANEIAVAAKNEPLRMIESILRVLPDTKTVLVVIGASKLEQFWLAEVQRLVRPYEGRLTFQFTNQLSFAEIVKRCGSLPPHSVIFYTVFSLDASGAPYMEEQTLDAVHAAANAPMFGLHSHQLGHGIVGGPLLSLDDLSRNTATVAVRLLHGETPASIESRTLLAGAPQFDERELRRWGIPEERLQPGSTIVFREPPAWKKYEGLIATAMVFVSVQTLLVIGLAVTVVRRRRAARSDPPPAVWDMSASEAALAQLTHRLMQTQEDERSRIAAALHDDVCQQLTGLKMRLQTLGLERSPGAAETRARIEDLCDQFTGLERQILALTDPVYARLDMLGLTASARALCQRIFQEHDIALEFDSDGVPAGLSAGVTLALFRVLQEAMDNVITHAAARHVTVSLVGTASAIGLDVQDDGVGFDPEAAMRAGAVGLVGIRERLRLVGGRVTFESRPGAGARVHARVAL